MYARIYNKKRNVYYKSIIYCEINQGYYRQYVVIDPGTDSFELVDYLDKSGKEVFPLVEIIQCDRSGWRSYENARLLKYKAHCKASQKETAINYLQGYPDVCEDYEFISSIMERRIIPVKETGIAIRRLNDTDEWNYIQTQEDANEFMKLFAGFHDSKLDRLRYEERAGTPSVAAVFDNSGWYGIVELRFEGVTAVNLRPAKENCSCEIFEATLMVRDETVLWADWYMEREDLSVNGSYIKALNLKWRKIE